MKKKMIIQTLITLALISAATQATPLIYAQNARELPKDDKMRVTTLADSLNDTASIDAVLKALYEAITFAEGNAPDLSRFRNLFASEALCIRINQDQKVDRMTVDAFILSLECVKVTAVVKGTLSGTGKQGGADLSFQGDIAASDAWYFAYKEGIVVKTTSEGSTKSTITVSGPQNMTIPMTLATKLATTLLNE